jgi:hypothetical protein
MAWLPGSWFLARSWAYALMLAGWLGLPCALAVREGRENTRHKSIPAGREMLWLVVGCHGLA